MTATLLFSTFYNWFLLSLELNNQVKSLEIRTNENGSEEIRDKNGLLFLLVFYVSIFILYLLRTVFIFHVTSTIYELV